MQHKKLLVRRDFWLSEELNQQFNIDPVRTKMYPMFNFKSCQSYMQYILAFLLWIQFWFFSPVIHFEKGKIILTVFLESQISFIIQTIKISPIVTCGSFWIFLLIKVSEKPAWLSFENANFSLQVFPKKEYDFLLLISCCCGRSLFSL